MSADPVLRIRNLTIHAAATGRAIVNNISLDVNPREVVALIGASGSGKTTLALSALGQIRPGLVLSHGSVTLDGKQILSAKPEALRDLRGRIVAYVAQSAAASFNPRILLDKQVIEPSRVHHTHKPGEALAIAHANYRLLGLSSSEHIGRRYAHEVSGGQLQRFMIAMGLQEKPLLLVCDEPTSALDVTTQVGVLRALKDGIATNLSAALFVSHDLAVVAQIADRIAVLRDGVLVELGDTAQILHAPVAAHTRELLDACRHMTLSAEAAAAPTRLRADAEALLAVRDVGAGFGQMASGRGPSLMVLRGVTFAARRGEVVAVIGESGSGKSTLANVIAGMHPASAGTVSLAGTVLRPQIQDRSMAERQRIQIVLQSADTALNQRHTVGRILGRVLKFFKRMPRAARARRIAELLEMVQLPASYAARRPRQMSGGEKQRVNLARALAAEPDVLICDEITSALDTVVAAAIVELIESLRDRLGLAIIVISHDIATVASLADYVIVLHQGRVVEHGPTAALLAAPTDPYPRLLIASVPELRTGWLEQTLAARREGDGAAP
jgi:peptide/nickel transport system ATP-binding protein